MKRFQGILYEGSLEGSEEAIRNYLTEDLGLQTIVDKGSDINHEYQFATNMQRTSDAFMEVKIDFFFPRPELTTVYCAGPLSRARMVQRSIDAIIKQNQQVT